MRQKHHKQQQQWEYANKITWMIDFLSIASNPILSNVKTESQYRKPRLSCWQNGSEKRRIRQVQPIILQLDRRQQNIQRIAHVSYYKN